MDNACGANSLATHLPRNGAAMRPIAKVLLRASSVYTSTNIDHDQQVRTNRRESHLADPIILVTLPKNRDIVIARRAFTNCHGFEQLHDPCSGLRVRTWSTTNFAPTRKQPSPASDSAEKAARDMCGPRLPFQRPKVWLCGSYSAQFLSRSRRQPLNCLLFRTIRHC